MQFGIKNYNLTEHDQCLLIAEIGVNHNGDPQLAQKLVDVAIDAGADIVKVQAFRSEKEISKYAIKAPYQLRETDKEENQLQMCKSLELPAEAIKEIRNYCNDRGIGFLCTAFDPVSFDMLTQDLGETTIKIPSGEITNIPFLEYVGERSKSIVLSTGASSLRECASAIDAINKGGCKDLLLLHCVTNYPADARDANLRAMETIRKAFGYPVGFSDHSMGTTVAIAAAALGAVAIEKHITLDRTLPGPDHRSSIEPTELCQLVQVIKEIPLVLGTGKKEACTSEYPNIPLVRKSLVAARDLKKGQIINRDHIEIKRPASGIEPVFLEKIIGMTLTKEVSEDVPLTWDDFK